MIFGPVPEVTARAPSRSYRAAASRGGPDYPSSRSRRVRAFRTALALPSLLK